MSSPRRAGKGTEGVRRSSVGSALVGRPAGREYPPPGGSSRAPFVSRAREPEVPLRPSPNPHVQLTGTGSCVGEQRVDNAALAPLVKGYDAAKSGPFEPWVDQVTHIHERPFHRPGGSTSDLALPAARQALEAAGIG